MRDETEISSLWGKQIYLLASFTYFSTQIHDPPAFRALDRLRREFFPDALLEKRIKGRVTRFEAKKLD